MMGYSNPKYTGPVKLGKKASKDKAGNQTSNGILKNTKFV